jgi:GTPase
MLSIRAHIELYAGKEYRQTPFMNGYRPLFNFVQGMKKSGKISLINKDKFNPGEHGLVDIVFLDNSYLGSDFGKGKKFTFGEGPHVLGEGLVIDFDIN